MPYYKVAYPRRKKRKREYGPIPYVLSLELTFLPDGLEQHTYEQEVRRVIRENMFEILQERNRGSSWFEEYDDRISEILEEEIARN